MYSEETNYYHILGISPGATKEEIKAAYRRLARQYHPDVNADPGAKEEFQKIVEAYQYLTKAPVEEVYAQTFTRSEAQDLHKDWREKVRARRARDRRERDLLKQQVLQKVYRVTDYLVGFYLLFASILTIDYFLPAVEHPQEIEKIDRVYSISSRSPHGRVYLHDEIYFKDFKLNVSGEQKISCCGEAIVHATPILGTVLKAELKQNGTLIIAEPAYGLYHFFGFLIPLALLLGGIYYRHTGIREGKLNIGILLLFMGAFHLVLFFFLRK